MKNVQLKIIKHEFKTTGDTDVYGNYGEYCKNYDPSIFDDKHVIPLNYFGASGRKVLKLLAPYLNNVEVLVDSSQYDCPYTEYTHYGLIPVLITTDDPTKYLVKMPEWLREAAADKEWNRPKFDLSDEQELQENYLTSINTILLGSGYTTMTIISDGSNYTEPMVLELENGDNILCFGKVWYNK